MANNIKIMASNGLYKLTETVAKKTVNSACLLVHGQPKEPESLKRLKKIN